MKINYLWQSWIFTLSPKMFYRLEYNTAKWIALKTVVRWPDKETHRRKIK